MQRKMFGNETKWYVNLESLEPFLWQRINEIAIRRIANFGVRRDRRGIRKTRLEKSSYSKLFRGAEAGECFALRELQLMSREKQR